MVRKRKKREDGQPPWCYYCDRVFSDEPTLVQHQKAKHFKCTVCHKRLTSAGGLRVHCHQVHRFALEKVPSAKPGKESMDVEVFGMAGVPDGAVPGAPPPEEDESAVQASKAAPLPPQPLLPPGSQMSATPAVGLIVQSQSHYMPKPMHPLSIQQPMQGAPPYAPPAFPGMPPPFMRPPPGMVPLAGYQMPGLQSFQQQGPLLNSAGAGPHAQGQPVFPISQGAACGAPLAPGSVLSAAGGAQPAQQPQPQPVFPISQGGASRAPLAAGPVPGADLSAQPDLQEQPVFPGQAVAASAPLAPGIAGGLHLNVGRPGQAQPAGVAASTVHGTPLLHDTQPSPATGYGTLNGSMHTTPAHHDAPALDESNPALIWKAIDISMEESRAQQLRYQQKLTKAGYMK